MQTFAEQRHQIGLLEHQKEKIMNMSVIVTFQSESKNKLINNSSLEQKNISKRANENLKMRKRPA